jgi:hypothetical protein
MSVESMLTYFCIPDYLVQCLLHTSPFVCQRKERRKKEERKEDKLGGRGGRKDEEIVVGRRKRENKEGKREDLII